MINNNDKIMEVVKMFKRIIASTLALIMTMIVSGSVYATEEHISIPATEKECIEFVEQYDIKVPDVYKDKADFGSLVKKLIDESYEMPVEYYPYSYTELRTLAEEIRSGLLEANLLDYDTQKATSTYTLQNSTVYGSWSESFLNYNCYGYAIGNTSNFVDPGYYSGGAFSMSLSISSMASLVVDDLEEQGYWAYYTSTKPSSLASFEKLICIRKGTYDYHFMKYFPSGNSWRHKPGNTHILKYNYSNAGYNTWTNECSFRGVSYPGDTQYDSSIRYIIYWPKNVGPQPRRLEEMMDEE
jgi:hypothetical protein